MERTKMNSKDKNEVIQRSIPIVAKLAEKFTSKESTSVSYDIARQLMNAVLYCIREGWENSKESNCKIKSQDISLDIEVFYQEGNRLVLEKVLKAKEIYNKMVPSFQSYGNRGYQETVIKGMREFFKYYDPEFNPQNHILTLDYPLIQGVTDLCGIDIIYQYLICVKLEQEFLNALPEDYIIEVLSLYHTEYESLFINISCIVLRNVLARMIVGKSITAKELDKNDYQTLEKSIKGMGRLELSNKLIYLATMLVEQGYSKNPLLAEYLKADVENFSFELVHALEHNNLEVVFVTGM